MAYPDRQTAEKELCLGEKLNPGKWGDHSRHVAKASERIAAAAGMDADKAYVLGLLHDIGRRVKNTRMYHVYSGYVYCMQRGWDEAARICLTHSYQLKDTAKGVNEFDGSEEEYRFIENYIQNITFDDYDLLIQLTDALALAEGICIIERRLVDVALRYGFLPGMIEKWRRFFELKEYFDRKCGCSIYDLLPEAKENLG